MTEQAADVVVRQSIVVQAPIERAFQIYTEGLASWWPMRYRLDRFSTRMAISGIKSNPQSFFPSAETGASPTTETRRRRPG